MEYLRPGGSLFALAFRERDAVQELYRAVSAVSGRKETAGERLRIAAVGDDLCLEPEGEPGLVIGHWMNLRGEAGRLPWGVSFLRSRFGSGSQAWPPFATSFSSGRQTCRR